MPNEVFLHEIFSAVQGEGPFVGVRQLFVRLCECNLACRFCDTPASRGRSRTCRIEQTAGARDFAVMANPLSADQLDETVVRLNKPRHHSLSLTGGEPLLQADFLVETLPRLRKRLPIYLETNGTLPNELEKVLQHLDFIAMDIKLPSATGVAEQFAAHAEFLAIASKRARELANAAALFVKIVITADTDEAELAHAFGLVATVDPAIEVVLQPVSEVGEAPARPPAPEQVLKWQSMGLEQLNCVRVIPQMHRLMGQL